MDKKMIIIAIVFILLMVLAVFLGYKLTSIKGKSNNNTTEGNIVNTVENKIENNVTIENKNEVVSNEVQNNTVEKTNTETEVGNAEIIQKNVSNKQKALEIAENNWGADDTVYFDYDGTNSEGKHIVCVRDKNTTQALYWYKINVETGEFTIE